MRIKLICIPYAGATGMVYLKWKKYLSSKYEIIPIDIPGRGKFISKSFLNSIEEVADSVYIDIFSLIKNGHPYILYGHSMGTLIIYELLHRIIENKLPIPLHVFLSGRNPPFYTVDKIISGKSEEDFYQEIFKYGGTPIEFFQNKELMKIFLPILKSDYELVEKYQYQERDRKLPVNISYFFSNEDPGVDLNKVKGWEDLICGNLVIHHFKGGHFFIHDYQHEIINQMMSDMSEYENVRKSILLLIKEKDMYLSEIESIVSIPKEILRAQISILKQKDLIIEDTPDYYSFNATVFQEISLWLSQKRIK